MSTATTQTIADRIEDLDWPALTAQMDEDGFVQTPPVLSASECRELAASFEDGRFRSTIDMRRYRFGEGEYKYFDAPLPDVIDGARHALYPPLADAGQRVGAAAGGARHLPGRARRLPRRAATAPASARTTPLILRYREGGHNTLHQDVYGDVAFPLQVVTMLDRPGEDFEGGQFVLLEQRPRAQSRAHVIDLERGAFLIFPTRHRPVLGTRGHYRATMRHGVATVRSGRRTTLGVIFHDAA